MFDFGLKDLIDIFLVAIFLFFGCKALTRGAAILTKQAFLLVFRRKEAA